jgi:hypothetical protein
LPEEDEGPAADDPSAKDEVGLPSESSVAASESDGSSQTAIDSVQPSGRRQSTSSGDSDTLKAFEFSVLPGAPNAPPEILTEREHIPQKWVRLPLDLGKLRIDLSQDAAAIDRALADFNAAMVQRIEAAIDAWEKSDDPETGGLLWAFPAGSGVRSRMVVPAEVVGWDQTLANLRTNRRAARPRILPVLEYENLEDPLRPDERTVRIILANESDLIDADQAAARETDATLYQVELGVEFEHDLHRPIRLERIEPSYRYNRFLTHDALGINCGVRRQRLTDPNVLETTALPVYFQPLIKQFEISPPPTFDKLGAADGGIDILRSLLAAFDDWLASIIASKPYESALDPVADAEDYAREKHQFETVDLRRWRAEREALARGVTILERAVRAQSNGKAFADPEVIPLTAWRFMNQTFKDFWALKNKSVTGWRLFQIAFIISQIPAIVSRLSDWKDSRPRSARQMIVKRRCSTSQRVAASQRAFSDCSYFRWLSIGFAARRAVSRPSFAILYASLPASKHIGWRKCWRPPLASGGHGRMAASSWEERASRSDFGSVAAIPRIIQTLAACRKFPPSATTGTSFPPVTAITLCT